MALTDVAVLSVIAAVAAFPLLKSAAATAWAFASRRKVDSPDTVEQWRQKWTATLITLGREIEAGNGSMMAKDHALMLTRELMWEIIGGDAAPTQGKGKA